MKYPKYKLAFPGKHALVFNGHPMTQFDGYTLGTYASGNGIISASKQKGFWGESAELFQSAAQYHTFEGYSANKGTINGNTYVFGKGNDIVTAFFNETEIYNLFLNQTQGGTISADKLKGYKEQSANLSYTANQDYYFNGWASTGANIQNNQVPFTQDTTARASFAYTSPLRTIHTNSTTKAANADRLGSYKATVGSDYDLGTDYIVTGTPSAHGWSAEYLGNIEAIHFKFKPAPITLNGSKYLFGMTTVGEAAECSWYDGTTMHQWTANQSESIGQLYFYTADTPCIAANNNRDGINGKKLAMMSANRFPVFSFSHAKTSYVNSTYAENINGTIYAKCDDWTTGDNDIKIMMRVSAGSDYNKNEDRTCFVSAYYNNNFVGSAWQGLYNILYRKFYAYFGLFSATTSSYKSSTASHGGTITNYYDLYLPVAGSSQFDLANFSNIDNAKRWLDSL